MFSGIVEELGKVKELGDTSAVCKRLVLSADKVLEGVDVGDSIAVNGACLTVVEMGAGWWSADVVRETLACTVLGDLAVGDIVNLERSLCYGARIDGHLVQGHVDGVATLVRKEEEGPQQYRLTFEAPDALMLFIARKGSVAVDGVSLTVADVSNNTFSVALIPHTAQLTTLGSKGEGAKVNLEVDVLARYVARLMNPKERISETIGILNESCID